MKQALLVRKEVGDVPSVLYDVVVRDLGDGRRETVLVNESYNVASQVQDILNEKFGDIGPVAAMTRARLANDGFEEEVVEVADNIFKRVGGEEGGDQ